MPVLADVLVIGGGAIGLTTAWQLTQQRLRVLLCDPGAAIGPASPVSAGIIPPAAEQSSDPISRLRTLSVRRLAALANELNAERRKLGFHIRGGLQLLEPHSVMPTRWRDDRIPFERVDGNSWQNRWPWLSANGLAAYYFPGYAQLDVPVYLQTIQDLAASTGFLRQEQTRILAFRTEGQRIRAAINEQGQALEAGWFVIANGAWAGDLLRQVGCRISLFPVRGQLIQYKIDVPASTPLILQGKRYVVPWSDGRVLVGSTEEPEAGFDCRSTADAVLELKAFAGLHWPTLNNSMPEKSWAGLRPCTRDEYPRIGFVPGYENLLAAVGHFRAGIQLAPATAELLVKIMTRPNEPVDFPTFDFNRKEGAMRNEPAFQS